MFCWGFNFIYLFCILFFNTVNLQERLKLLHRNVFEIEDERNRSDHTLNNITKTHDKITLEGKLTPYYQVSLIIIHSLFQKTSKVQNKILKSLVGVVEKKTILAVMLKSMNKFIIKCDFIGRTTHYTTFTSTLLPHLW